MYLRRCYRQKDGKRHGYRALVESYRSLRGPRQRVVVLPTLKYAPQRHYKYVLGVHLIPMFGEQRLSDISREAIQTFLIAKLRAGLSWETVHHFRCALSKVLGSAEEWGYIADNPARKARLPRREHKSERSILAPTQIRRLISALPQPTKSAVTLLVMTGLRIGELLALRWKGVELGAQALRITETVYDGHFDTPKSKRSVRSIPIGPKAISTLSALRKAANDSDGLVFSTRAGQPLSRRNLLHRHLQPTCEKLGLPIIT